MANFNFDCPHCGRAQTVTVREQSSGDIFFETSITALGNIGLQAVSVCCANPDCLQPTVVVHVKKWGFRMGEPEWMDEEALLSKRLIPETSAKPQPDYIPAALREDYVEACRIRELSPKASATLARRCLQGMIRDFCGIKKGTLNAEIIELKKRIDEDRAPKGVSDDSVEAIDAVRKIGNIGAHMEKDINLIINVAPDEADTLIEMIETLFNDWYVEREKRRIRFSTIREIAAANDERKGIAHQKPVQIGSSDNQETD